MTKEEMMAKIANAREKADKEAEDERNNLLAKMADVRDSFRALAPRIKQLLDVAKEMQRNGFTLGQMKGYPTAFPEFETDWWNHKLGFFCTDNDVRPRRRKNAYAIGCMGGGACGEDLKIDENGEVVSGIWESRGKWKYHEIQYVLREFNDFERRFYDYVESL